LLVAGVYLDHKHIEITENDQQILVATLTIALFVGMALELLSPEILFMIALIIIMLCQILSMSETLSGKTFPLSCCLTNKSLRIRK
jgi:hypothetical protein